MSGTYKPGDVGVWAHSANEIGLRHGLAEHLRSTGQLARRFASPFGAGDLAETLGLLHDAGKADCAWQERLLEVEESGLPVGRDHKSLGARMVCRVAGPAAMAILGHHGGLTSRRDLITALRRPSAASERATQEAVLAAIPEARTILAGATVMPAEWTDPLILEMGLRLTFSALVDADHLDTAAHFAGLACPEVAAPTDMRQLVERFETAPR